MRRGRTIVRRLVAESDTCREGHALTGDNVVWGVSRGRAFRRCRVCRNAYHAALNKSIRRDGYREAIKFLRDVAAAPGRFPPDLVADVLALAAEIRTKAEAAKVRGDRPFDFSKAIRNPYASRLRAQASPR